MGDMKPLISIDARMIAHSGIGTYLRNILPCLIDSDRFSIELLGNPELLEKLNFSPKQGVSVRPVFCPIYSFKEHYEVPAAMSKNSQLLWVPHFNIPWFYKGRLVVTIHDILPMEKEFSSIWKRLYTLIFLKRIEDQAETVFTDSLFTAKRLEAHNLLIKSNQPVITPLGIHSSWLNFQPGPRPHNNPYILYVGNIKPHKNLKTLLKAHSLLTDAPDLILVGKKSGFIQGDSETIALATNNLKVHFTGEIPISDETLSQYYRHAEALVFPSLYEGFGLPPLEAMACGCPCIASDISVLREFYDGSARFYSPPKDEVALAAQIEAVLKNPSLRQEMIQKGLQKAISSTWEVAAQIIKTRLAQLL